MLKIALLNGEIPDTKFYDLNPKNQVTLTFVGIIDLLKIGHDHDSK